MSNSKPERTCKSNTECTCKSNTFAVNHWNVIRCKLCITLHTNHKWTATPEKSKSHNTTKCNFSSQHGLH